MTYLSTCGVCSKEFKHHRQLSAHISKCHTDITKKEYYDTFILLNENLCVICGSETKFINIYKGYADICSQRCSIILYRKEMKNDDEKFKAFSEKVSNNMKTIWKKRDENGEKDVIMLKTSKTIKEKNSTLSENERKVRYGWLNRIDENEKNDAIQKILNTGCHVWWKNASDTEKELVYEKRTRTYCKTTGKRYTRDFLLDEHLQYEEYSKAVRRESEKTYRAYKKQINPSMHKRDKNGYHLDHIFSISDGFKHKVPVEIISSVYNLRMLYGKDNCSKNSKSDITLNELYEMFNDLGLSQS